MFSKYPSPPATKRVSWTRRDRTTKITLNNTKEKRFKTLGKNKMDSEF